MNYSDRRSRQPLLGEVERNVLYKFERLIATADALARASLGVSWSDSLDATWLMYGIKEWCAWIAYIKDYQP